MTNNGLIEATPSWRGIPGALAISWVDRPSRNAIGRRRALEIEEHIAAAEASASCRYIILGAGMSPFCSGWDVRDMAGLGTMTRAQMREYFAPGRALLAALNDCQLPIIAAVNGPALGFGCSLLSAADIVIADEQATFGLPEITRGFPPATVMPELLEVMSLRWVRAWALTGYRFSASEAQSAGLVHRVVETGLADDCVEAALEALVTVPVEVLQNTKSLVGGLSDMPLATRRASGVTAAVNHFFK